MHVIVRGCGAPELFIWGLFVLVLQYVDDVPHPRVPADGHEKNVAHGKLLPERPIVRQPRDAHLNDKLSHEDHEILFVPHAHNEHRKSEWELGWAQPLDGDGDNISPPNIFHLTKIWKSYYSRRNPGCFR